jgi:hypothetical protein
MLGFLGVGCGDDSQPAQQDAAVHQDTAADVSQADQQVQDDVAVQDDATIPTGLIVVSQVGPQPTGSPLDSLRQPAVFMNWPTAMPTGDTPTNWLDKRGGGPIGCYAAYYKFDDGGVLRSSAANLGAVKVASSAGWHGSVRLSIADDGGVIPGAAIANPLDCARVETDAGTGLFKYGCGLPSLATPWLEVGDRIFVEGGGPGTEVPFFALTDAGAPVAPFPHVTSILPVGDAGIPALWAIAGLFQTASGDGGVTLDFACGTTDGGTAAGCNSGAIAVLIESSDAPSVSAITQGEIVNEYGVLQCSKLGGGTSYLISEDLWLTAFPPTGKWRSLRTAVTQVSVNPTPQLGMGGTIGAGGGEVGLYNRPVPDGGL